jgi:hypothetical protein
MSDIQGLSYVEIHTYISFVRLKLQAEELSDVGLLTTYLDRSGAARGWR